MSTLNSLLVFKDQDKGQKIAEQLYSWNFTNILILNSLNEVLNGLDGSDLVLMDTKFKNDFEEILNENNDLKTNIALIYIEESSTKNFDLKLFKEKYTQLNFPFNFSEFRTAAEIAYYKKNYHKNIKKSEELSKEILNASFDSLLIIDNNGNILDANNAAVTRLNRNKEDIIGFNFKNFLDKKVAESRWKYIQKAINTGKMVEFEDIREDIYYSHKIIPLNHDGMVDMVVIDSKDITQQKNSEQELLKINSYNRTLIESSIDPILTLDFDGHITDVNNAIVRIFGLGREELVGTSFLNYFREPEKAYDAFKKVMKEGSVENYPLEVISKDKKFMLLVNASKYRDEKSNSQGIFATGRDVTDIKRVEDELNNSESRLKAIVEGSPIPQFVIGKDHKIIYWNRALEQLSGLKSSDMIGTDNQWKAFYNEKRPCMADLLLDESGGQLQGFYNGNIRPSKLVKDAYEVTKFFQSIGNDGKWLYITSAAIKNAVGEKVAAIETLEDISKTKILEADLNNSLAEKDLLIKEIHHRVKNNLMIISSLLSLQSGYVNDKEDFELFRESQTRAKSMALIHERLYKSGDLKSIDFDDYIKFLVKDLLTTYNQDNNCVDLKLDLESIKLDINTAIPLGLIVNELVSNSMKHAFTDDIKGEIWIELKLKDDKYVLIVGDNGVGVPENIDFKNTESLGLQLVTSLTKQIDGNIELNTSQGTEFKITFRECFK